MFVINNLFNAKNTTFQNKYKRLSPNILINSFHLSEIQDFKYFLLSLLQYNFY